jgi:hypothetical protein
MCFGLSVGRCVEAPPGKKKPPKPHEGYALVTEMNDAIAYDGTKGVYLV